MIEQVNGFITPMKEWNAVGKNDAKITGTENGTKSVFQSVLEDTVQNVYDTQKDVEQKQYLLATGQLEDATTNARTIIWHQFCFLLFFKLLKVLLDTELGVS